MKIKVLLPVFLIIFLCISCNNQEKREEIRTNDVSLARIIARNELIIGVDPTIPPLSFYASTGKIVGYEVDVAQAIADRLGVHLRLIPISTEDKILQLENRSIDYIASGFINRAEYAEYFSLSSPYLRDAFVVIVTENIDGSSPFKDFSDLRNKRIGVLSDPEIVDRLTKSLLYKNSIRDPYLYPRLEKLLVALDYGQLEGAVINLLTYYNKITKEKKRYRIIGEPLLINTYSYVFRKEDKQLQEAVDVLLTEMAKDTSLRTISIKWFGADVSMIGKY